MTGVADAGPCQIWMVDLEQSGAALTAAEQVIGLLTDDEKARASAEADRHQGELWRVGRVALRIMLASLAEPGLARASFARTTKGKPFIAASQWSFNVSHSGTDLLLALARDGDIGIDLECDRSVAFDARRDRLLRVAGAAMAQPTSDDQGELPGFLQAWTRLEAVAKARALGLQALLSDLGIRGPASDLPAEEDVAARARTFAQGVAVADLQVGKGRYGAVASTGELPQNRVPRRFPSDLAGVLSLAGSGDEGVGG